MDLTIFLARFFGLYIVILSIVVLFKWKNECIEVVRRLVEDKTLFYIVVIFELLLGIALVLSHNRWDTSLEIIVSTIGWLTFVEACVYMFVPHHISRRIIGFFNRKWWYTWGSAAALLLGAYLLYHGFFV